MTAPVLSNCWGCRFNVSYDYKPWREGGGLTECNSGAEAVEWIFGVECDENDMPPRDATGCPGFEPKPGTVPEAAAYSPTVDVLFGVLRAAIGDDNKPALLALDAVRDAVQGPGEDKP